VPKSRKGAGRPFKEGDKEKLLEVRRIRGRFPKLSYHAAALRYAQANPEEGIAPASTARRLARKLKQHDGVEPRRKRTRKALLRELYDALLRAAAIVEGLLRQEGDGGE
jgi:hypothetical protein